MIKPAVLTVAAFAFCAVFADAKLTPDQLARLPAPATDKVDFARDIQPIFEASCVKCHGRGKEKGGFQLDTRETFLKGGDSGPVATAGQSAGSLLIELVSGLDPDNVMPVKGSKLTARQVSLLRAWIDQGMSWDASINFARRPPLNLHPRQPELPPARRGVAHPIDRLLQPYFDQHQVKAGKSADDRTFARRVYLDVIGLLPPPKELETFLADRRDDKRERLVTQLLGDQRRYAEHWLSFWNDLLRNDYKGAGYIDGGREQISSWLYAALYQNTPYDRFVAELINPTTKSAGFTKGIVWRGTVNASQLPPMQAAQNISQVFMGVNLKCASCHDSFINDWSLADAYALANIYADEPLELFQCDKPTGKKAGLAFIYRELGEIPATTNKVERTKRLAEIITGKPNGRLTRTVVNRLWAKFLGRGLVEPVDDMDQAAWNQDLLDWLAEDFAAHGYDLKHTMKLILTSRAYALPGVSLGEQQAGYVFTGPAVRRLSAEQFRDALATLTGVWYSEPAKGISLTPPGSAEAAEFALPASAKWIWSERDAASRAKPGTIYLRKTLVLDEAPKAAWAVASCDNSFTLYVNGTKVVAGKDWNDPRLADLRPHLKKGTNLLAVSAINHTPDDKAPDADAPSSDAGANPGGFIFFARLRLAKQTLEISSDQSWLWTRHKMDGWEKPKTALADDAQPAAELGGPSQTPWSLAPQLATTLAMSKPHTDVRASLVAADTLALALGRPPREQVLTTRADTATTLQALELTNGDTLDKVLKRGAEKLLAAKPASNAELVTSLYARALGRKPTSRESKLAAELLGQPARKEHVEDLLWALAMLPEFQLIY